MSESFLLFIFVGFLAQMVDGCLGMAYGVISATILTTLGLSPSVASASVHFSELFTTFASAISHIKLKNINRILVKKLVIPGVIGGIIGAYILVEFDSKYIKPFISIYLLIMGIKIIIKGINKNQVRKIQDKIIPLGFFGGFFDAIGGGGWGPIVTSTLVARGNHPRNTIGTVNTAEFFVTLAQSATFFLCLGSYVEYIKIIAGLLIGGIIAAPFAAFICKKINISVLTILVGIIIIITNLYSILRHFVFK